MAIAGRDRPAPGRAGELRLRAAEFRAHADRARDAWVADELRKLAEFFDQLADSAERGEARRQRESVG